MECLSNSGYNSVFLNPVSQADIELEIRCIPNNKAYGFFSFPIPVLSYAKHITSGPLAEVRNISFQEGVFPSKLKQAKVIPISKGFDETEPGNNRPPYFPF